MTAPTLRRLQLERVAACDARARKYSSHDWRLFGMGVPFGSLRLAAGALTVAAMGRIGQTDYPRTATAAGARVLLRFVVVLLVAFVMAPVVAMAVPLAAGGAGDRFAAGLLAPLSVAAGPDRGAR
jgi:hypothetical protein